MSRQALVARGPRDATELEALLRVRAEGFRGSWMARYCDFGEDGLELDRYDAQARHLGVYLEGGWGEDDVPIAYCRSIGLAPVSETLALLGELGLTHRVAAGAKPIERLPAFTDFFDDRVHGDEAHDPLYELSRITVKPAFQGRRVARFLVDAAAAWGLSHGNDAFVFRCSTKAEGMYRSALGAARVADSGDVEHCNTAVCFLGVHEAAIPHRSAKRVFGLRDQLLGDGVMSNRSVPTTSVVFQVAPAAGAEPAEAAGAEKKRQTG
ncbi:MAG: GNAT family N-acetyltransferase [Myxococcota bacterium]